VSDLAYTELIRELFPRLTGGIRWGLERTVRLLAEVGDPHLRFPCLHVGGTNGKGSVAATLASVLTRSGLHTGLYTSPHLCTFRERIQRDGVPIGEAELVSAAADLWPAVRREAPSFFEATTAIAFHALARAHVEVAVIEVGLGGRLDATNVIRPEVAVVTNVALDHTQFLGPSLESIAREKAGILKPGVPALTAEQDPIPLAVLRSRARAMGVPLDVLDPETLHGVRTGVLGTEFELDIDPWGPLALHTPLAGRHQALNTALAVRALARLPLRLRPGADAVVRGVAGVRWPGRLQVEHAQGRTWVFDVAHNVAGVQAMTAALLELELPPPRVSVVGVLGDKDWQGMLRPIYAASDAVVLTLPPTAPEDRRWDPHAVLQHAPAAHALSVPSFTAALARAHELSGRGGEGTILVTGSFHTVGDALIALGIAPFGVDADLPVPIFMA
jgi:dihydrofolate synthase/folylpolyglutamate synthase